MHWKQTLCKHFSIPILVVCFGGPLRTMPRLTYLGGGEIERMHGVKIIYYDIDLQTIAATALNSSPEFAKVKRKHGEFPPIDEPLLPHRLHSLLMFSGLNPPDGEPKTPQRFFEQNTIFGCVKNFMHLFSFYLSLIISISL